MGRNQQNSFPVIDWWSAALKFSFVNTWVSHFGFDRYLLMIHQNWDYQIQCRCKLYNVESANRRITHVPESIAFKLVQCSVESPWQLCMQARARHPHKQSSGWGGQWAVSCWFLINWKLLRGQCPGNGFPAQLPSVAQSHPDPRNGSHYWAAHQTHCNQTCERRLTMLSNANAQATFSNYKHALSQPIGKSFTNRCMVLFAKIQLSVRISEDQRFLQG